MRDPYKVQAIDEYLDGMRKDKYCLTRLRGDSTRRIISIDETGLKLLKAYYNGQINPAAINRL